MASGLPPLSAAMTKDLPPAAQSHQSPGNVGPRAPAAVGKIGQLR
jgi:hypothetical protein